ncbi:hypothetical protein QL285_044306 [Trifolium repens]|nr:hypothetical protein QL285_044306 [Trifolium repens]
MSVYPFVFFFPAALQFVALSVTTCRTLDALISSIALIKKFNNSNPHFFDTGEVVCIHKHIRSTVHSKNIYEWHVSYITPHIRYKRDTMMIPSVFNR